MVWLAGLALALRLSYLWLGTRTQSLAEVCQWANDTRNYLSVAHYWLKGDPESAQVMLLAGPGYGFILAGLQALFAGSPMWPALVLNVLFGCVAPVVVYLLALELTGRRNVALGAGLISAASVTGLSVSTSLLSDQPFYTLHALALLWFVRGWRSGRTRAFVAAGLVAGIATWIRVMGQVWPVVFVLVSTLLVLVVRPTGGWSTWRRSLWTPAILLAFVLSWSAFNYVQHGIFTLTTNGARTAWLYLGARALALDNPGLDTETARDQIARELELDLDPERPEVERYERSIEHFSRQVQERPGAFVRAFAHNVKENVQESNYDLYRQLPQCKGVLDLFTRQARDWLNEWIFFGSLLGAGLLAWERKHAAWVVAGTTFAVFTLVTGFSFWQGARLHYPAEMGWAVLLSYLCVGAWERGRRLYRGAGADSS